ncbi:MAG TPA: phosphoglucomutase/phosphomannomutase family protein, partial [Deinococcales bacterium]|nr:phosphoglucomutase/phosphomannomutase family protein [Deinococcales bacterium]
YGVNPEPVPQSLESLRAVLGQHSDPVFGTVTDGDADRVGAVLAGGEFFNSHQIFAVLLNLAVAKGLKGRVVKTVSSSQVIDRLCELHGLELVETPVGFKYITDAFLEGQTDPAKRVLIGGEESGGLAMQGHIPERDGLLNSLLLLEATLVSGKGLRELFAEIEESVGLKHAYDRVDLHLGAGFEKAALYDRLRGLPEFAGRAVERVNDLDGVKFMLSGGAWILFRASGTEPLVRLYCEAASKDEVDGILRAATAVVQA